MMEIVYIAFFWALILQALIFLFLNMPTPHGVKGKIINFLSTNKIVGYLMWVHLIFCVLALFFYFDLSQSESFFLGEKDKLKNDVNRHAGTQLRIGFLSYSILKIQRNKYITFMLIYTSIALNIFTLLLRHIYKQREQLQSMEYLTKPKRTDSDEKPDSVHRDSNLPFKEDRGSLNSLNENKKQI